MKLRQYFVEYVCYANDNGYPSLDKDLDSLVRIQFNSQQEAEDWIEKFFNDDPEYVQMWVAYVRLHKTTDKITDIPFPKTWRKKSGGKRKIGVLTMNEEPPPFVGDFTLNSEEMAEDKPEETQSSDCDFRCIDCGGMVKKQPASGERREFRYGISMEIPHDILLSKCEECGEYYLAPEDAEVVDKRLGEQLVTEAAKLSEKQETQTVSVKG